MRWFRMYSDAIDNPKLGLLTDEELGQWLKLVCVASKYDGQLPDLRKVAFHIRKSVEDTRSLVAWAIEAELFDSSEGVTAPHDWDEWQRQSDEPSTARVQAFRKRKQSAAGNEDGSFLKQDDVVSRNNTKQFQQQNETASDTDTDTEADTERETEENARTVPPAPVVLPVLAPYRLDEAFCDFKAECEQYGIQCSEQEWQQAYQFEWLKLPIQERLEARPGIQKFREAGDSSLITAVPRNILRDRKWKRRVRDPAGGDLRSGAPSLVAVLKEKHRKAIEQEEREELERAAQFNSAIANDQARGATASGPVA